MVGEVEVIVVVRTKGVRLQNAKPMVTGWEPTSEKPVYQRYRTEFTSSIDGVSMTKSKLDVWFEYSNRGLTLAVQ